MNSIINEYSDEKFSEIVKQSFSITEVLKNMGYRGVGTSTIFQAKQRIAKLNLDTSHFYQKKNPVYSDEEVFCENSVVTQDCLRRRFLKKNVIPYECAICGNTGIWNNKKLTLRLDHIDGENNNNVFNNLRWLCPNCDSQLDTYCGANKKAHKNRREQKFCQNCGKPITFDSSGLCVNCSYENQRKVNRPSKEELLSIIKQNNGNFTQTGKIFGVTDNTIRKWCKCYDLPFHSKDYN